ncbi:UNVERIFIED_CONTAM: hypothetical protein Sradi_5813300 [Sesamum radiatum]|uniref:Uncharacterized protein n=1 Tax=Sesamum radiatum TaxID=300843 RepID=A0AAW2KRS0_SESRA
MCLSLDCGTDLDLWPSHSIDSVNAETPLALLPGVCAKAAFSYQKSNDLWRQKETKEDVIIETEKGQLWRPSYDIRLREPHAAISGIIGGTCMAWASAGNGSLFVNPTQDVERSSIEAQNRVRFRADLFGSVCYTFQHGKFRNLFGDLTRIDARLDILSASDIAQKVAGPVVFRVDSKFSLDSSPGRHGPQLEDLIYSLNYSLRILGSGKVVAWYSPRRKEGMVELRLLEF